jgi:hypothetical protein
VNRTALLARVLMVIAAVTVVTGLAQVVAPGPILGLLWSERSPTTLHFFGIVGMFMVLFGGMMLQALLGPVPQPVVVFWSGLQKAGASVAVGLGVVHAIFSPLAWAVSAFDLFSSVLYLWYWQQIRTPAAREAGK